MSKAFGSEFVDKMAVARYQDGAWTDLVLEETLPIPLHPAAHVLHYSSTCFEGLKAHRSESGQVNIFRLDRHVERMRQSAERLCLPVPPVATLRKAILDLVGACQDSIPSHPGSLYLRPTLIGTTPGIGGATTPSEDAILFVIASPVGNYFGAGQRPLRILIEENRMRSTPEFGATKAGGNYAVAMRQIKNAKEQYDVDQVLFCPHGDVQETGAANFLLFNDRQILTKRLDDSILHGVTRDSLLRLGADLGLEVLERDFTVRELLEWIPTGEAALSGTAAVLAGVGTVIRNGQPRRVGSGEVGEQTQRLREALTSIQRGLAEDRYGWLTLVE